MHTRYITPVKAAEYTTCGIPGTVYLFVLWARRRRRPVLPLSAVRVRVTWSELGFGGMENEPFV